MTTDVTIVMGANYGDEGKGLATAYFAHKAQKQIRSTLVVCSNGGAQRGHTVELEDGRRHVFHHFGSGTFFQADTYLPEQFIVNPIIFREEWEELQNGFTDYLPLCLRVYVHNECMVSTPFDMILNQIIEDERGKNRHGSCGIGIWETIARSGYNFYDYMYRPDAEIKDYLKYIRDEYFLERLEEHGIYFKDTKYKQWWDIVYSDELITHFIKDLRFMQSIVILVNHDNDVLPMYERVIFENGQGLLLDQRLGLHTTPSNTGIENPMKILENAYKDIPGGWLRETGGIELCYVTRPYLTRHGADDMFQEADNMSFEDKTNVPNRWQGKLKFGYLDLCMLQKRISTESSKILINQNLPRLFFLSSVLFVTHCDHSDYMTMHMEDNCTVFAPIRYKSYGPTVQNVTRCDT